MPKTRRLFLKAATAVGVSALTGSAGCLETYADHGQDTTTEIEVQKANYRVYMGDYYEFDAEIEDEAYWIDEEQNHRLEGTVTNVSSTDYENVVVNGNIYDGNMILGHGEDEIGILRSEDTKQYILSISDDGVEKTPATRFGLYVEGDTLDSSLTTAQERPLYYSSEHGRLPSK